MSNQLQPLGIYHVGVAMGYAQAHEDYLAHGAYYAQGIATDEGKLAALWQPYVRGTTERMDKLYIRGYRRAYKHYARLALQYMCGTQAPAAEQAA